MQKLPTLHQADSCRTCLCTHHPPLTCGALIPHWMVPHWKLQFTNPAHRVTVKKSNNIMTLTHIGQMQTNNAKKTLCLVTLIFTTLCVCYTCGTAHTWRSEGSFQGKVSPSTMSVLGTELSLAGWLQCFYLLSLLVSHWVIKNDQLQAKERKRDAPRGS